MTPEEIAASEDVGELFAQLKAAKAFGDDTTTRLIEARMRELSGANTRADGRGKRVAVDEGAAGRVRRKADFGGAGQV